MKTIEVITDRANENDIELLLKGWLYDNTVNFSVFHVDTKATKSKREAQRVVNKYAVTKLPFVLLIDDELPKDEQEYAAVYSESGPITIDRINEKL